MPIISTNVGIYNRITGAYIVDGQEQMQKAMEELYHSAEERKRRGSASYDWVCGQGCRIEDKVEWLEEEIRNIRGKRNEHER